MQADDAVHVAQVAAPAAENDPPAQSAQSASAVAEDFPSGQVVQVESADAVPVVQSDPAAQSVAAPCVHVVQDSGAVPARGIFSRRARGASDNCVNGGCCAGNGAAFVASSALVIAGHRDRISTGAITAIRGNGFHISTGCRLLGVAWTRPELACWAHCGVVACHKAARAT